MPKMKTHSGCKKRFSKNSAGKVKRAKAFRRHHSWAKTHKRVRSLRIGTYFEGAFGKKLAILLP